MELILLIASAFVLGSIPFGVVLTKAKGIDLRKVGSGNIGATNVLRAAGKMPALMTLLGDLLKGTAAVALGKIFGVGTLYEGFLGLTAIAGHDFSLFLRFKGGKGVATSIGVLLIYMPKAGILTVIIWLATVFITRYSSLGAIVSFALLPVNVILLGYSGQKLAIAIMISALLILKHSGNIKRLVKGTERRIGERA
jgi:glycerol-3-phosphate acyltransferase PlsY